MPDDTPPDELAAKRNKDGSLRQKPGNKRGRRAGTHPGPTSGAREIRAQQRSAQAVELRLAGATLQQIADRIGYADPKSAREAIMRALRDNLPDETRHEARLRELATLDRLQVAHWEAATRGEPMRNPDTGLIMRDEEGNAYRHPPSEKSALVVMRCSKARRELGGLDEPVRLDVRLREGEPVRVELFEMLSDEYLEALRPIREEMVRLSELRAGEIVDVDEHGNVS